MAVAGMDAFSLQVRGVAIAVTLLLHLMAMRPLSGNTLSHPDVRNTQQRAGGLTVHRKIGGAGDVDDPATGSSLPGCSRACGPCSPCRRVMVSFKCSVAESCPVAYRCMCRGRFYHVPSG